MRVVRFLERKNVIRTFGVTLILAPVINLFLHILIIKFQSNIAWSQFQFWAYLQNTNAISLFFAVCSIAIGVTMLSGSTKAWKFVLVLLGSHLLVQVLNVNDKAWKGPLAWPSFFLNAGLFFFIFDQLVWKIQAPENKIVKNNFKEDESSENTDLNAQVQNMQDFKNQTSTLNAQSSGANALKLAPTLDTSKKTELAERTVINLKSYRKIYFSFGSPKPWGELKTLSSEYLAVRCITEPPKGIENKVVQINFAQDVVVDIQYSNRQENIIYFKPLDMTKEKVTNLNKWLNQIAV
jgi:hypothetical protein